MRFLPRRLAPRLVLTLTLLVAVVESIFAYVHVRTQEQQLLDAMVRGTDQLARSITSATWHAMRADRREDVYQTLETIGTEPGIESIRIFNKEGRVTYSTDPNAPAVVDKSAEACFLCHSRQQPLVRPDVPSRARIYRGPSGDRRMAMVTPIYNEPACSTAPCHAHPSSKSVLGVLDISMTLATVDREVAQIKLGAIATTLTQVVLLGLCIVLLTHQLVGEPIRQMTAATAAMSATSLGPPLEVESPAELRQLAQSFNAMRERLRRTLEDLGQLTHDLERQVEERSRQLSQAQRKLIQSDRLASLGQLSASVAHEINNPVSGVLNLSMLLRRILQDDGIPPHRIEEFRRYLTQISDESARAGRIVTDLLAFSRRPAPQRAATDVNTVIRDTLSLIAHRLTLGNVVADFAPAADLPRIPCDSGQMQQVVLNLVMNAAESMPSGGRVRIRTWIEVDADVAGLEVEDSGTGIPEQNLSRIFDPFFTTKDVGKGIGLGLSVVYGIVDSHAGTIDVRSEVGVGTTFTVRLPLHTAAPIAAHAAAGPPAPGAAKENRT